MGLLFVSTIRNEDRVFVSILLICGFSNATCLLAEMQELDQKEARLVYSVTDVENWAFRYDENNFLITTTLASAFNYCSDEILFN